MNDSGDLRRFLKAWPYDPEHDARIVRGEAIRFPSAPPLDAKGLRMEILA